MHINGTGETGTCHGDQQLLSNHRQSKGRERLPFLFCLKAPQRIMKVNASTPSISHLLRETDKAPLVDLLRIMDTTGDRELIFLPHL